MPGRLTRLNKIDVGLTNLTPRPRLKPRGLPPALEPHGIYTATNPADAAMYGEDLLGTHRIRIVDGGRLNATFHAVLVRDVTLGYLEYGAAVEVDVRQLTDDHLVLVPASGSSVIENEDDRVTTSPIVAAIPTPKTPLRLTCDADTAHLVVRIRRDALDMHLARLLGHSLDHRVVFDLEFPLSGGRASRWNFAVQILHAELFDPDSLLMSGIGQGQLEEFMMSALLYSQKSNYSEQLLPNATPIHKAVRDATGFIDRNLAKPVTVADIAAAADVSVRTLQNLCRDQLGQTPTNLLANRRLERARAELADATAGSGVTVTEIASRWGFTHLGRFSTIYKSRFGESPSQTLRN